MSPRKKTVSLDNGRTRPTRDQPGKATALLLRVIDMPAVFRFGICVLSSLMISSLLYKLTASITVDDFAHVSKSLQEPWEIVGLIAWRAVEIGLVWIMTFDCEFPRLESVGIEINPSAYSPRYLGVLYCYTPANLSYLECLLPSAAFLDCVVVAHFALFDCIPPAPFALSARFCEKPASFPRASVHHRQPSYLAGLAYLLLHDDRRDICFLRRSVSQPCDLDGPLHVRAFRESSHHQHRSV